MSYKVTFTTLSALRPVSGPPQKHPELETMRVVGEEIVDRQQIPYSDSKGLVMIAGVYSWTVTAKSVKWSEEKDLYLIVTDDNNKILFAPNRGITISIADDEGNEVEAEDEDEAEEEAPKKKKVPAKKAPAKKTSKRADPDEEEEEDEAEEEDEEDEAEEEEEEAPKKKKVPAKKAPAKKTSKRADPDEEDEAEEEEEDEEDESEDEDEPPAKKPGKKTPAKGKKASDDDNFDWEE